MCASSLVAAVATPCYSARHGICFIIIMGLFFITVYLFCIPGLLLQRVDLNFRGQKQSVV